jgi:hypothetical protein
MLAGSRNRERRKYRMRGFRRAGWALLLVGAIAATSAMAFVATGNAKKASFSYVNVGAAAFTLEANGNSNCTYRHRAVSGEAYSGRIVELYDDCDYVAHVDLPDGMRIASITAYYNNADADGRFRFEANDDVGDHVDLAGDDLDGSAGGAVCDGSDNCSATWQVAQDVNNETTHYGIDWEGDEIGLIVYRFRVTLEKP